MKVRPSSSRILGEAQDFRGIELIFYCAFISSKGVTRIIKLLINIIRYSLLSKINQYDLSGPNYI
ncbi:MAG TPA: hypothetical protein PKK64_09570, partial [Saprospiraceae bacterium]|nr:hypothetical protein [Saprospiraceae bacterium]